MVRVAVALSGGLDSSVTAYLLQQQGYDVIGITGKMIDSEAADLIIKNAKSVADFLGINHYTVDATKEFKNKVTDYFDNSYKMGYTPNPCIMCNKFIKWGQIFDYAINKLGADYIATGHYANIKEIDGIYKLYPAKDTKKDQLYFLFLLTQNHLSRTLFPLYNYEKSEIRGIAINNNLPTKSSKESQDICFIQKPMTTKKYLLSKMQNQKGDFINVANGKKIGEHEGYFQYTIGQRKGIGIAAARPLYVTGIDADKNIVYVGTKEYLEQKELILNNFNFSYNYDKKEFEAMVKIRYNMQPIRAKIQISDNVKVSFIEPVNAVSKGQACVLYDINDGHLMGGGFI